MENTKVLKFNLNETDGGFKPMNATNGGPWHKRHTNDQYRSNFKAYKAARMPYSRNHDSQMCGVYGGPYSHDITAIFPNFDADENDPNSYDFACTDESILCTLEAGTETFFRLGQTIEHQIKKHGTLPPKDFHKWARICEHIIRHYNEGWADGYHLGIQYWEVWNEYDLNPEEAPNQQTWGGTAAQFFDLFEISMKHLKARFPNLKIGGPASVGSYPDRCERFFQEMQKREVPMDFYSWHTYDVEPTNVMKRANAMRELMTKYGYGHIESILNELNYVANWNKYFTDSIMHIHGIKGAMFALTCMTEGQANKGLDMIMYYDTRPSAFCGAFDFYTYAPLKTYYSLMWYGMFYDMEHYVPCQNKEDQLYTMCGKNNEGKVLAIVSHYSDDPTTADKEVKVDFGKNGTYEIYALDNDHDGELVATTSDLTFTMPVCSALLIKEI